MNNQVKLITKKNQNISEWYNDVIATAKLAEHGPSKGSMIMRPYGYAIWERAQKIMDEMIKSMGIENAYFPLFIPYSFLEREKSHIAGFAPELAVVTHGGGEKLAEPLVVRPTSETIIYDAFSRWIESYRDLPLKVNQWCNVVRWEKRPNLFFRTTEFLWQEGHTAHAALDEAKNMVQSALKMYVDFYQTYYGVYGYMGRKSESEKFAGAEETYTYEMLMPDGKALQGCTSHNLGQNFSKVFKVKYQTKDGKEEFVYQTSWGFATRSIGALIMVHGDDNGLVIPPMIAPVQIIVIPIVSKKSDIEQINSLSKKIFEQLESYDYRVKVENSEQSPGWKFNQADLEGIPLRIEVGSREAESSMVRVVRRDTKGSFVIPFEQLPTGVDKLLRQMQEDLLSKSKEFTVHNTRQADTYEEFRNIMNTTRGFIEAFWCEDTQCETKIKEETKASTRCLPLGSIESSGKCVYCGKPAKYRWIFAQSY